MCQSVIHYITHPWLNWLAAVVLKEPAVSYLSIFFNLNSLPIHHWWIEYKGPFLCYPFSITFDCTTCTVNRHLKYSINLSNWKINYNYKISLGFHPLYKWPNNRYISDLGQYLITLTWPVYCNPAWSQNRTNRQAGPIPRLIDWHKFDVI